MIWAGFPVPPSSNINMTCEQNSNRSLAKLSEYLCDRKYYEAINIMLLEFLITWKMLSEMLLLSESGCETTISVTWEKKKTRKKYTNMLMVFIPGWWDNG